jgi:hypothetical protein
VTETLPDAVRGYAVHAGWLDDVFRVGGERSGRLVRGRDIVRDRDVFPGAEASQADPRDGEQVLEEMDVLVCGGQGGSRAVCTGAKIKFFFPRSTSQVPLEDASDPRRSARRSHSERGCDTPLFQRRSPQYQHNRPIELQTMDFLEILSDRVTATTEHAWVRERGWLVILPPASSDSSAWAAYELTPGTESVTRVMGCGCLLQRSIVCLSWCVNLLAVDMIPTSYLPADLPYLISIVRLYA